MFLLRSPAILTAFLLCGLMSLCGCASDRGNSAVGNTSSAAAAPPLQVKPRNFSGHWEKNFQLSDDFNTRLRLYIADLERAFARQSRGLEGGAPANFSNEAINGLARFTEELTRMPLLEIMQDEQLVTIEREGDFPLRCAYAGRQFARTSNSFGSDICGWERESLVFQMALGGGLTITHQFTLSPDANMLNVTTRVSSSSVAVPLVISNYYRRYDPPEADYDCQLTLTRRTVCSQRGNTQR